jgi:hypothetical protein
MNIPEANPAYAEKSPHACKKRTHTKIYIDHGQGVEIMLEKNIVCLSIPNKETVKTTQG